jgi:nicotinic acid mononucleotide adenylyltransferase
MSHEPHYDWLIWIGRFQPIHAGHVALMRDMLTQAPNLAVYVVANEISATTDLTLADMPDADFARSVDEHHGAAKNPLPFWFAYRLVQEAVADQGLLGPVTVWGGRRPELQWGLFTRLLPESRAFVLPVRDEYEDVKARGYEVQGEATVRIPAGHIPEISATLVRERLAQGADLGDLLLPCTERALRSWVHARQLETVATAL